MENMTEAPTAQELDVLNKLIKIKEILDSKEYVTLSTLLLSINESNKSFIRILSREKLIINHGTKPKPLWSWNTIPPNINTAKKLISILETSPFVPARSIVDEDLNDLIFFYDKITNETVTSLIDIAKGLDLKNGSRYCTVLFKMGIVEKQHPFYELGYKWVKPRPTIAVAKEVVLRASELATNSRRGSRMKNKPRQWKEVNRPNIKDAASEPKEVLVVKSFKIFGITVWKNTKTTSLTKVKSL